MVDILVRLTPFLILILKKKRYETLNAYLFDIDGRVFFYAISVR